MQANEILMRLEEWKARHDGFMQQYQALSALTGADLNCALMLPVVQLWEAYSKAVAEIIGDNCGWLSWYELECDMGQSPMRAMLFSGEEVLVDGLIPLVKVITAPSWVADGFNAALNNSRSSKST